MPGSGGCRRGGEVSSGGVCLFSVGGAAEHIACDLMQCRIMGDTGYNKAERVRIEQIS